MLKKFREAAKKLGYHTCMVPASNSSQNYTNPDKQSLEACQYCAFCEYFGCEYGAKAFPIVTTIPSALATKNLDIKTYANVLEILHKDGKDRGKIYQYFNFRRIYPACRNGYARLLCFQQY